MSTEKATPSQFVLVTLAVLFLSCGLGRPTPIGEVLKNPRAYDGKSVTLNGTITDRVSIYVFKFFILKDSTGEIPVVTERILPNVGAVERVHGKIREAFAIGNKQLVVLLEDSAT